MAGRRPTLTAPPVRTDGPLAVEWFNAETVALLDAQGVGPGLRGAHLLRRSASDPAAPGGRQAPEAAPEAATAAWLRDAIWFGHTDPLPERVRLAYRLSLDEFQGQQRVQMVVEAAQA